MPSKAARIVSRQFRYYLGQEDNADTNQVQPDAAFPMVAAVNLEAYDSLLGGGVRGVH
ncbi:hypothetical protein SEF58_09065 [Neomoorella humiferrea]